MQKKSKKKNNLRQSNSCAQNSEIQSFKVKQSQSIVKLSKKQKKKLKKEQKFLNDVKAHQQQKDKSEKKQNLKQHTFIQLQESQGQQNDINQIQSLITINSSSIENNYGNQIDFDLQQKQGFQDLINQSNQKLSDQVSSIQIKRFNIDQVQQVLHIFHIKKQTFYKVTSLHHQNINSTHLNQTATLKIIDQNLLQFNRQETSLAFWLNGKSLHKQISFFKSTVFKIVPNLSQIVANQSQKQINQLIKSQGNNHKKNTFLKIDQKLKENIHKFIKPITSQQTQQLIEFLRDFQSKEDCLLVSKEKLHINQTSIPFQKIDEKILNSNNSLMILGKKNTGKSTLSEYLKNTKTNSVCILDCDIGRSLTVSGCVSLLTQDQNINLWIGEFTPFNCIRNYVAAIKRLYQIYRIKYFSKKLVINTMGYLSGLGEIIIYEIYHLVNPSQVIVINSRHSQNTIGYDNIGSILKNIKTGAYFNKLLTLSTQNFISVHLSQFSQKKVNLTVQYLNNEHAQSKGIPIRFENLLMAKKNLKNIIQLIKAIKIQELEKASNIHLFSQDKLGNVVQLNKDQIKQSDMRIVLIGKQMQSELSNNSMVSEKQNPDPELFRVFGIGFGYDGNVYFSRQQIQTIISPKTNLKDQMIHLRGLLSEGVDFQKNFYLLNQLSLIEFELQYGPIPHILPIFKGMGSKGLRNNPSKNH